MVRTYLKAIFILFAAYQTTECMDIKGALSGKIAAGIISTAIAASVACSVSDMGHPYTGLYLMGCGALLAALRPLSKIDGMPIFFGLRNDPIFKNYQFYFSLAFLASGAFLLAYHNKPSGSSLKLK